MPEFDGTGPCGQGPMTGGGRGFCILHLPRTQGEAAHGFAGLAGEPVVIPPEAIPGRVSAHYRLVAPTDLLPAGRGSSRSMPDRQRSPGIRGNKVCRRRPNHCRKFESDIR